MGVFSGEGARRGSQKPQFRASDLPLGVTCQEQVAYMGHRWGRDPREGTGRSEGCRWGERSCRAKGGTEGARDSQTDMGYTEGRDEETRAGAGEATRPEMDRGGSQLLSPACIMQWRSGQERLYR